MDLENLTKQFTRFFVPGLAFLIFAVMLPTTALGKDLFFGKEPAIGATQAILLSIVAGYVLDSIRGYRFTLSFRQYDIERKILVRTLANVVGEGSSNPDDLLAVLWKRDEANYNRIFVERAEWVMILETSFAMLISSILLVIGGIYLHFEGKTPTWQLWPVPILLTLSSYLASKNGVERMKAHNRKLVEAVKALNAAPPKS
jgi:ABC-type multidrug transport system fused ATPase/permease subunit